LKIVLRLFILLVIVGLVAGGWVWYQLNLPYQGFQGQVFLDFPVKTRTEEMARLLVEKGVIQKAWLFTAARVLAPRSVLQAGEYQFDKPASTLQVFSKIAHGEIYYQILTVPEGHNIFDIVEDLRPLGMISGDKFLKAAGDPAMIRDLDPDALSLEGYLFPDSYRVNRHTTADMLVRQMTLRFRSQWKELGTKQNVHEVVTLASMIEREAKLPAERPVIASVFTNRLKIGMKLDCDPTTVYAALLENRYRGKIYKSDLASTNPYNTYTHPGLPPGPIANPGLSSLKGALAPVQSDYLYFVAKADGSGGHNFSNNLMSHLAAAAMMHSLETKH